MPAYFKLIFNRFCGFVLLMAILSISSSGTMAQVETPPAPSAPRPVKVPPVHEAKLKNGLKVAVVQNHSSPLVTVWLLVDAGANFDGADKAGLANITASMLTKGTKARSATKIAEDIAFLGGTLDTDANWNSSVVTVTVTSDKLAQAMAILADVFRNPSFDEKELELLKTQTLDGLAYSLKQPSSLANYVASKYSFGEHPAGGTPESIKSITAADVRKFYDSYYSSGPAVVIFTGDITPAKARTLSAKYFSVKSGRGYGAGGIRSGSVPTSTVGSILVVDLPNSGQASVGYYVKRDGIGRNSQDFYPASVMNSILGGGYSSRLNQEIRIKRGLSYGAGSSLAWRSDSANFSARAQTKNESAGEVAALLVTELDKIRTKIVTPAELTPRKAVLIGSFGRGLETTSDLAMQLGSLYSFSMPTSELNKYVGSVEAVSAEQVKAVADKLFVNGDLIIVGDYSVFKDDLAKRFPKLKPKVIAADKLDLSSLMLQK